MLRTLLFVHGVAALGVGFRADGVRHWLVEVSVVVAAVLPATLVWLLAACALGRGVRRAMPLGVQWLRKSIRQLAEASCRIRRNPRLMVPAAWAWSGR